AGEAVVEFGYFFGAEVGVSVVEFAAVDDIDCSFGSDYGYFGCRPREIYVCSQMLRAHYAVGSPVGFSCDDRDLGDCGFGVGEEQFGSVADNASEFLAGAREEAGDVFEGHDRDVEGVAEAHEAGSFGGGVDVEAAGKEVWLIGYDAHGSAVQSGEADHDVPGEVLVDF